MTLRLGDAPLPKACPIAPNTSVDVDESVVEVAPGLFAGGSPWRLMRLNDRSRSLLLKWRENGRLNEGEGAFARTMIDAGMVNPRSNDEADASLVDVVIPVHNDARSLDRLLNSIPGLSVTVVDDGSENADDIARVCANHGASLLRLEDNRGPAAARNFAIRSTERSYVWFIDADVVVFHVSDTLGHLVSNFDDPRVGAVSARVHGLDGETARDRFESSFGALDLGASSSIVRCHGRIPYVPAACLMVRREALGDGFDESLRIGEDVDLVWRLDRAGWIVRHDAAAVASHAARGTWLAWFRQRVRYGLSAAPLRERHPNDIDALRVDVWSLATWLSVLLGRSLVALSIIGAASTSLERQLPESLEDRRSTAATIALRGIVRSGGPIARAVVRSYGPLILLSAVSRRLRRRALTVFVVGTLWRWRSKTRFDPRDLLPGVTDDLAYSLGLAAGAVIGRQPMTLVPKVTWSSDGLRALLTRSNAKGATNLRSVIDATV